MNFEPTQHLVATATQASTIFAVTQPQAIEEFRRWVQLKVEARDVDATELSPTPLIDYMWHAAILDTQFYTKLQSQIGMLLHHRPASTTPTPAELAASEQRRQTLRQAYYARFGSLPLDSTSSPSALVAVPKVAEKRQEMQLFVKSLDGRTYTLDVAHDETIKALRLIIQTATGVKSDHQRIIFAGRQLEDDHTLLSYNIQKESTVHLVLRLC